MTLSRLVQRTTLAATLLITASLVGVPAALAAGGTPYRDVNAQGRITLCDITGHALVSGDIRDLPFARYAVSSLAATGPYRDKRTKATLYAFQPRKGVDPGDWSGVQLSGSSFYPSASHPTADITTGDKNLLAAVQTFPPMWQGFIQLRVYLNAPSVGQYHATYAATSLKIAGNRWTAADPGTADCRSAKAMSAERLVLAPKAFPKPSKASDIDPSAGGSSPATGAGTGGPQADDGTTDAAAAAENASSRSGSSPVVDKAPWLLLGLLTVAGAIGAAAWVRRRS